MQLDLDYPDNPVELVADREHGELAFDERPVRLSSVDVVALVALGLLPIALLPGQFFPGNLRLAIASAALPLGAFLLVRRAIAQHDLAARLGLALVTVALVGAIRVDHWRTSIFGTTVTELSVIALLTAFGWWAIGCETSRRARSLLPLVISAGAAVNILVGLVQVAFDPRLGIYQSFGGRLSGLMSNPVFFASTFVGLWAFWFVESVRRQSLSRVGVTIVLAFSLALSGSRAAAAIVVLTILVVSVARPGRFREIVVVGVGSIVALGAGTAALNLLSKEQNRRFSNPNSGLELRFEAWKGGLRAWLDRPVLGWGPDPYQRESNQAISPGAIGTYGRIDWPDPHNVVVLVAVSVGVVGVALLLGFVASAMRGRVDHALLAAAGAIALSWMLQPVMVSAWPLAFAFFGAAVRPPDASSDDLRPGAAPRHLGVLIAVGVVGAIAFSIWSFQFESARGIDDPRTVETRAGWLIADPEVAIRVARHYKNSDAMGAELAADLERGRELAADAVRQGGKPGARELLIEIMVHQSDLTAAMQTARDWVADWPNDPRAYRLLGTLGEVVDDPEARAAAREGLCEILGQCDGVDPDR